VKRTGRGELIGAIIHICMGTTQGISLCSYLYLKLAKCHVSHFIFYVFSFTKSENWRAEQVLSGGVGTVEGGQWQKRGYENEHGANKVYTCM
jgi:hypothetical protein